MTVSDGENEYEVWISPPVYEIEVVCIEETECPDYFYPKEAWPKLHQVYTFIQYMTTQIKGELEGEMSLRFQEMKQYEDDSPLFFLAKRFKPLDEIDIETLYNN